MQCLNENLSLKCFYPWLLPKRCWPFTLLPNYMQGHLCMNWNEFTLLSFLWDFSNPIVHLINENMSTQLGRTRQSQGAPFQHNFWFINQSKNLQNAVPTWLLSVFVGMKVARAEWAFGLDFTVGCIFNHLGVTTLSICAPLSLTTALFLLRESELWVHQIWSGCISWHETETSSIAIDNLVS